MAKKNTIEEPKHSITELVSCMTCEHSSLHRYDSNPILAACHKKPKENNDRFPFEIEIANVLRHCKPYAKSSKPKEVEQRYKQTAA